MPSEDDEKRERNARLKLEAELLKPKVLAEQHKRLCEFIERHKKDSELYEFRCERYGDYLAVMIRRGEERKRSPFDSGSNKMVSAISLMNDRTIQLKEGAAPDTSDTAYFVRDSEYSDNRWHYSLRTAYFKPDFEHRPMIVVDQSREAMRMWDCSDRRINGVLIEGCAAPAVDDEICFVGSGVTLYMPFGRGRSVYDKILKAIRAGER